MAWNIGVVVVAALFAIVGNYLFALAGEPRSVWLMRDVLHVIK